MRDVRALFVMVGLSAPLGCVAVEDPIVTEPGPGGWVMIEREAFGADETSWGVETWTYDDDNRLVASEERQACYCLSGGRWVSAVYEHGPGLYAATVVSDEPGYADRAVVAHRDAAGRWTDHRLEIDGETIEERTYLYDEAGRLSAVHRTDGADVTLTWSDTGKLLSRHEDDLLSTAFSYDEADRIDGWHTSYSAAEVTYGDDGRVASYATTHQADPTWVTTYDYDAGGQMVHSEARQEGDGTIATEQLAVYDASGRVSFHQTLDHRSGVRTTRSHVFDEAGRLVELTYESNLAPQVTTAAYETNDDGTVTVTVRHEGTLAQRTRYRHFDQAPDLGFVSPDVTPALPLPLVRLPEMVP